MGEEEIPLQMTPRVAKSGFNRGWDIKLRRFHTAGLHGHIPIREQCGWTIGYVEIVGKIRTCSPSPS